MKRERERESKRRLADGKVCALRGERGRELMYFKQEMCFNIYATVTHFLCGWRSECGESVLLSGELSVGRHNQIGVNKVGVILSRRLIKLISIYHETKALEFLEKLEDMFSHYW